MARSLILQARKHINIPGPCSPSDEKWDNIHDIILMFLRKKKYVDKKHKMEILNDTYFN